MEQWESIPDFPKYAVSSLGRVRRESSGRILVLTENQYGVMTVGLMGEGRKQWRRSVPLLVADAFIPRPRPAFDTPICMDGDRTNNAVDNLAWRPRWFAVEYNRQFIVRFHTPIDNVLIDLATDEEFDNSFEVACRFGLLEKDVVLSVMNRTYVWPTYQQFGFA